MQKKKSEKVIRDLIHTQHFAQLWGRVHYCKGRTRNLFDSNAENPIYHCYCIMLFYTQIFYLLVLAVLSLVRSCSDELGMSCPCKLYHCKLLLLDCSVVLSNKSDWLIYLSKWIINQSVNHNTFVLRQCAVCREWIRGTYDCYPHVLQSYVL